MLDFLNESQGSGGHDPGRRLEAGSTKSSRRQFRHSTKPGTVTISGNPGLDMPPGTLNSVLKQAGLKKQSTPLRYMVVIEEGPSSFGAYVPDLPGCVAVGKTQQEALKLIHEAVEFHLEGLMEEGKAIPAPHSSSALLKIDTTSQNTAH